MYLVRGIIGESIFLIQIIYLNCIEFNLKRSKFLKSEVAFFNLKYFQISIYYF